MGLKWDYRGKDQISLSLFIDMKIKVLETLIALLKINLRDRIVKINHKY
jgi:hypothetical protein